MLDSYATPARHFAHSRGAMLSRSCLRCQVYAPRPAKSRAAYDAFCDAARHAAQMHMLTQKIRSRHYFITAMLMMAMRAYASAMPLRDMMPPMPMPLFAMLRPQRLFSPPCRY